MKLVFHFENGIVTEFPFDDKDKLIKSWDFLRNNLATAKTSVFNNTIINLSKVIMIDLDNGEYHNDITTN